MVRRVPAALGLVAFATAGVVSVAHARSSGDRASASSQSLASSSPGGANEFLTPDPMLTATMEELRGADAAGRSDLRPTSTPAVPSIVGTFAPLADCAAAVPTAEPANGRLGDDELCAIGEGHLLRADAAATYVAMDAAYAAVFGEHICITDSYRSFGSQQSLYWQKPGLAAVPGTSNHGWGMAVDVSCGIDDYASPEHMWLTEHGDEFGWFNPQWAQAGGSRPEPWHWEFDPTLLD